MIKTVTLAAAALASTLGAIAPAAADAQRYYGGSRYERYDDRYDRYQRRSYRGYDRGYRGRACKDGDGGTVIGAIAGGLLGRTIDTRGDRLLGTVLGAGAGALAGRAIDKSDPPRGCRR